MIRRFLLTALCALVWAGAAHAENHESAPAAPVVVELFTSQGCTSCPRANRILGALARQPDIIALTYGVAYWDYLGWRDTFARAAYANRQRDYTRRLHLRAPYTPQFVIGGARQVGGLGVDQALSVAEEVRAAGPPPGAPSVTVARLSSSNVRISVGAGRAPEQPADIWLIAFDPGPRSVMILAGDNAGLNIIHFNIVHDVYRVGTWNGAAATLDYGRCFPQCAVLVQAPEGGPILAAARLRREASR